MAYNGSFWITQKLTDVFVVPPKRSAVGSNPITDATAN